MTAALRGLVAAAVAVAALPAWSISIEWLEKPELYGADAVSTAAADVRLAISPDGNHELWGVIGAAARKSGWDIVERRRGSGGEAWSEPRAVSFDTDANEFDPAFALDGSGAYFFSNRGGGQGGDDIWFVPLRDGVWGQAVNVGAPVNTRANEWAPTPLPRGCLLFSSDGRGMGGHDLFRSCRGKDGWSEPTALVGVNTTEYEYDAAAIDGGRYLIFTRSANPDEGGTLYLASARADGSYHTERLSDAVNSASGWNFGPSVSASRPGELFYTSHWPGDTRGRADIYRVRYRLR